MSEQTSNRDQSASERSPWSRPGVLISGAFLLCLVLLGLVVAAIGSGSAPHPSTLPSAHQAASAPRAGAGAGASGCSLPAGAQTIPGGGPPPAGWQTVGAMQAPQSPAVYGPQRSDGPWETCFAHDPSGALLAALNFYAEGTAASPAAVMAHLAVGAPGDLGSSQQLDSSGPIQFAGYRYVSYTPSNAQVSIVFAGAQGKLLAVVTTMVWRDGDWKYLFPAAGTPAMQVLPDLTGYVPWSSF